MVLTISLNFLISLTPTSFAGIKMRGSKTLLIGIILLQISIVLPTISAQSPTPPFSDYGITVNAGPGGKISPDGGFAYAGSTYTFNITPDPGYEISDVIVDGISQGKITTYPFTNIDRNHEISATFIPTQKTDLIPILVGVGIIVALIAVTSVWFGFSRAKKRLKTFAPNGTSQNSQSP
jgi:hypothetical protein